ncbi:MAG: 4Fe-4S binding protein [Clostridiales bacterium]|nr:4Fe-4S binding protein [Clostridiales bacterium]
MALLIKRKRLSFVKASLRAWDRARALFQGAFFVLTNSFAVGWLKGTVYGGKLKFVCVPGLGCYSCPGAWGSCPIGALQAVLNEFDPKASFRPDGSFVKKPVYLFAFYVIGGMMMLGAAAGRLVCGFLCPFGFIQDLIYKIPAPKLKAVVSAKDAKHPKLGSFLLRLDGYARYLKYAALTVLVLFLPFFASADPVFCKYVCPSGMLFGGIPLMAGNAGLAGQAGDLTLLKLAILASLVIMSLFVARPFCRYFCPLGAFYALFNRVSLLRYGVDDGACARCGGCSACRNACPMGVDPVKTPNSPECIRCGRCGAVCPNKAISFGIRTKTPNGRGIRVRKQ